MRENKLSNTVFFSAIGLHIVYFLILFIAIMIKTYSFSDLGFVLIYLGLGIIISFVLTILYKNTLKSNGMEISDRIRVMILMQLPSTIMFIFCMIVVLGSQYKID